MSEEFTPVPLYIPDVQQTLTTPVQCPQNASAEPDLPLCPQIGHYVQFVKTTITSYGKVSCKETMGKIIAIYDNYADIVDHLGDVSQVCISNIKLLAPNTIDIDYFCLPSAV